MRNLTRIILVLLFVLGCPRLSAQDWNRIDESGRVTRGTRNFGDSTESGHKEIPRGMKVWTVDPLFGDRRAAEIDTMSYLYMNTVFTTGLRGEYNTTGNLGVPRQSRIFNLRKANGQFVFTQPFDYFITDVGDYHFTNTYSPVTNLSLQSCGNRTNGEDHFKALFAINAGKRLGFGFKFDYLYGRGYYDNQSTSLFNYTMHGSYLGDHYQAHLLLSTNHQKQAENGGITNDNYITHPESFNDDYRTNEIPTMLHDNWNRNDNQHVFLTHRYSLGFTRQVPMTEEEIKAKKFAMESQKENEALRAKEKARRKAEQEGLEWDEEEYQAQLERDKRYTVTDETATAPADTTWTKDEYVPVTSFIHTLKFDNYKRIYEAYDTPANYYAQRYNTIAKLTGDSIYDRTDHFELRNTFAIALLEGFNKYAKAGLKAFVSHDLSHFELPDTAGLEKSYNEHTVSVGGQISKTEGNVLHYNATAEIGVAGEDAGKIWVDAHADLNFRLFKDTVQLAASGFFHRNKPTFYYRHYHAHHFWWDNDLKDMTHTRLQGNFLLKRTGTRLTVAVDNLDQYTYFATSYDVADDYLRHNNMATVRQAGSNISVLTAQLAQDLRFGPVNLELVGTYQTSSKEDILPLPKFNLYANLYLRFKIAGVLKTDFGADVRYFTTYHAPDYVPGLGQYAVQENKASRVDIGNYPIVNVYANFHLQHTRFFIMMSHVNSSDGNYFLTPHYPLNDRILRFGVSWNFFN